MAELGDASEALHRRVGHYAKQQGIDQLMATGMAMRSAVEAFGAGARHFEDQQALISACAEQVSEETVFLVKGSRSAAMDKVVDALTGGQSGC